MSKLRALVPMFNKAPWGGLHENIWYSARGLRDLGWDITVACRDGQLVENLAADGIRCHVIDDWDDWSSDAERLSAESWDVIHGHTARSRELGLAVAKATDTPYLNTFHGYNRDLVYRWHASASGYVAVSRAHAAWINELPTVDDSMMLVVPNAVRDELLEQPIISFSDKISDGVGRVVVASRLAADKRALLDSLRLLIGALARVDDVRWQVEIVGGGGEEGAVADLVAELNSMAAHVELEMLGWVDSETVPEVMRGAVLSLASGRGAMASLAVGTPTIAFGSQGVYGLQTGSNLDLGLWGNFGGFPLGERTVTPVVEDALTVLSDPQRYAQVQAEGRRAAASHLRQSDADRLLDTAYHRCIARFGG
ncbi:glycosyltransferase family 4 protein [Aeromicrobium sp.]|uniref:glycosyltransferase family 4 protein n=1 Tax=Aeromicrobium sp. TaxID=1871063 RepID=UPI003C35DB2C